MFGSSTRLSVAETLSPKGNKEIYFWHASRSHLLNQKRPIFCVLCLRSGSLTMAASSSRILGSRHPHDAFDDAGKLAKHLSLSSGCQVWKWHITVLFGKLYCGKYIYIYIHIDIYITFPPSITTAAASQAFLFMWVSLRRMKESF